MEGQYRQFGGTLGSIRLRYVFRKGLYPDPNCERVLLVELGGILCRGIFQVV